MRCAKTTSTAAESIHGQPERDLTNNFYQHFSCLEWKQVFVTATRTTRERTAWTTPILNREEHTAIASKRQLKRRASLTAAGQLAAGQGKSNITMVTPPGQRIGIPYKPPPRSRHADFSASLPWRTRRLDSGVCREIRTAQKKTKNATGRLTISGRRSAVNGQRSVVNGQRAAVRGKTVSGQQSTARSQRPAVNGQQSMASSQWSEVNGQQSTASSKHSTVSSQRSTVSNRRSAANGQRTIVNGQRVSVNGQQSTVNG